MWAAACGALALLKRHFGLAIEVGRQGQGQARQRRKSLVDKWFSPTSHLPTLLLVTRRKATPLLIQFQESLPGQTAKCPNGPEADMLSQGDRLRQQMPRKAIYCGRCSNGHRGGSMYQQHLVLLVRVCVDSDRNHGCKPSRSGLQSRFKTFVPFMDICKIIKKPTFKSYNL